MGNSSVLGLLFEISADPSRAESALHDFEKTTGTSFAAAGAATKPFNDSLLTGRESVRLLAEEFHVHLPRAVTSAVSEIMPSINMLGPALLGGFAVMELPKLIEGIENATNAIGGFGKEARAAFADAVKASNEAYVHFRTIKEGVSLRKEINENIAALTVQRDMLDETGGSMLNYVKAAAAFLSGNAAQAAAYASMARLQQTSIEELTRLEGVRLQQLNRETELEKEANKHHAERVKREGMTLRQWHEEMIRGGREAGKVAAELAKHQDEMAASAIRADKAELQFAMDLEKLGIVDQRNLNFLKEYTPNAYSAATATEHLGLQRKVLAGVTQDLQQVEDAFRKALQGERGAMDSMMEGVEGAAEAIASMTESTKAVAYVRGAYDAAKAIECMAAYIESYGTDVPQLLASIQWAAAADQQFSVAGSGSRHGGGGGGGYASRYGASPGGSGGSGGGGESHGPQLPGSGPSSQHAGVSVSLAIYGHVFADNLQVLANKIGQGIQNGTIKAFPATQSPVTKGLL